MKHELRHIAYRPTRGGASVPISRMINDLGDQAINYIGTFSEFNPIGIIDVSPGMGGALTAVVRKDTTTIMPQKEFRLDGYVAEGGLSYHGSDFNNNGAMSFSKQDLLRIANAMDETDKLIIAVPDSLDDDIFLESINKVTK